MFRKIIKIALTEASGIEDVNLEFPTELSHGDYSTNVALINAKGQNQNPRDYAQNLVENLQKNAELSEIVSKIEIAGPGFINFYLSEDVLKNVLSTDLKPELESKQKVIVEYSSPNIAKRFSIGHFRSTVIGQAIYNIYDYLGYEVYGINHIGDWGTQFGMILAEIELTDTTLEDISLDKLEKLYTDFNSRLDDNPELRKSAKDWFRKLEEGDAVARARWEKIKEISLQEFEKTYNLLNVSIDEVRGESFYVEDGGTEDKMSEVISNAEQLGIVTKGEEGAKIIEFEDMPPGMLLKSDGTTTYFTRDLAAIKYRVEIDKADVVIYEVGSEQILHFRQVFAAAKMFEWGRDVKLIHVPHGLVRLKSGKMSTRKGNTIKLDEIIQKAIDKSTDIKIAIGALKYNDLKRNPIGEIIFDWDEVLSMEGNSGPYLQYSVVRANSVLIKAGKNIAQYAKLENPKLGDSEKILIRKLSRFDEVIIDASKSYSPSTLATYLYDLASEFNSFYNNNQILGVEEQDLRLAVTKKFVEIETKGLELLGIQVPNKM